MKYIHFYTLSFKLGVLNMEVVKSSLNKIKFHALFMEFTVTRFNSFIQFYFPTVTYVILQKSYHLSLKINRRPTSFPQYLPEKERVHPLTILEPELESLSLFQVKHWFSMPVGVWHTFSLPLYLHPLPLSIQ